MCGLFEEDQKWYRAIVLDVGTSHQSCLDSLDPSVFSTNVLSNPTFYFIIILNFGCISFLLPSESITRSVGNVELDFVVT